MRELRGNVDTRLRRLAAGDFDAIVLARAGLERLGRAGEGTPLPELVPAPGQGCLALEARSDDAHIAAAAAVLTDRHAADRADRRASGGDRPERDLQHAGGRPRRQERDDSLVVTAFVGLPDGSHWIRDELSGPFGDPAALGRAVAERLEAAGARELLDQAERAAARH